MGKSIYSLLIKPSGLTNALAPYISQEKAKFFALVLMFALLFAVLASSYTTAQNRAFTDNSAVQLEYTYKENPKRSAETNAIIEAVRESTDRSRPSTGLAQAEDSQSKAGQTSSPNYQVTVNGENISVPQNGSVSHTTSDGNVNVQVQSHNSQTSSEDSKRTRNSSSITIKSSTKSNVSGGQKEQINIR